jgi:branched-chain amino acid transport system substrate-binding protein
MCGHGRPEGGVSAPRGVPAEEPASGSITRGFLFADLRGYTRFVESRGAPAAAELLLRYRELVRGLVGRFAGSEIRTEGDSFYVVFPAVSAAVQCGLAVVAEAQEASVQRPDVPIAVGVGIHAGETIETPDGYVGGPVNIAARLCALAAPGEVLVSDTVRALTSTVLPVAFISRGRRTLKGVSDPIAVFAVVPSAERVESGVLRRLPRAARIGLVIAVPVVIVGLALVGWMALRPAAGLPPGSWKIAVDLPLSGNGSSRGTPMKNAAELAIDQANAAGGIGSAQLTLEAFDDMGSQGGKQDPARGAANVTAMIGDPGVIALIGPSSSQVAAAEIPITNGAGLLECSPATTDPGLTKARDGALDLRSPFPTRINFVRTAPADDIQGPALASFVYNDLGAKKTLVVDDADQGRQIADEFAAAYTKLGGAVVRRALNTGADPASVLTPLSDPSAAPSAVFFGGFTDTGAAKVRAAMAATGHATLPFVSWDGIQDGSGADGGSFIASAGTAAAGSYFSHASIAAPRADFVAQYRAKFGADPDEYAAAAYACAQVILDTLRTVAATGPSPEHLREAVRAQAVDQSQRYDTVLGTIGFDANGDSLQQFVTFYKIDASAAGGKGDWVIDKQQDYGPAP